MAGQTERRPRLDVPKRGVISVRATLRCDARALPPAL